MATAVYKENRGQFRVAAIGENKCTLASYNRSDFYKISLVTNHWKGGQLFYGSLAPIVVEKPALVLINSMVPHSWQLPERRAAADGYFCLFNDEFTRASAQLNGLATRLFAAQESPVYLPGQAELHFLTGLFAQMRAEAETAYQDKDDLFRSYLSLVFHKTLQMQSAEIRVDHAGSRIATAFISLLGKQFPVDLPLQPVRLKKASDFADRLAVHVNHLNMAVQKATGKSTTQHISGQLFAEARSLLGYTSYSIAEISYGLGFEYQSYFNRFFKKYAGISPSDFRKNFEKYK